ncbi:conserved hypothetical protein [Vibrio chagasii]|nr:conserved hypothetical protein [Vibrio chagasii]CAH6908707.1 conserved hypothetical protein [Vibrio chagasii]
MTNYQRYGKTSNRATNFRKPLHSYHELGLPFELNAFKRVSNIVIITLLNSYVEVRLVKEEIKERIRNIYNTNIGRHLNEYSYAQELHEIKLAISNEGFSDKLSIVELLISVSDFRFRNGELKMKPTNMWDTPKVSAQNILELENIIADIDSSWLTAKYYDVIWSTLDIKKPSYVELAINAYRKFPLEHLLMNQEYWSRSLQLCGVSKSKDKKQEITQTLLSAAVNQNEPLVVSRILNKANAIQKEDAFSLIESLITYASKLEDELRYDLSIHCWEEIEKIIKRFPQNSPTKGECKLSKIHCLTSWGNNDYERNNFYVAAERYRDAIGILQKTQPIKGDEYEDLLFELEKKLTIIRDRSLEVSQSVPFITESLDLSEDINEIHNNFTGDCIEDFLRIGDIDYRHIRRNQRKLKNEIGTSFILSLVGSCTYSDTDGRKIGQVKSNSPEHERIEEYEYFKRATHIISASSIIPAIEISRKNLALDFEYFHSLVQHCVIVPEYQTKLFAKALWHGYSGDFSSSIMMLCPLVENCIRNILKLSGIPTIGITSDPNIENEKAMGKLLQLAQKHKILNRESIFKINAIFLDVNGYNFRNKVAHGLLDDSTTESYASIYVWWLCLKWVIIYTDPKFTKQN